MGDESLFIQNEIKTEELINDTQTLRLFQKQIKNTSKNNIDELQLGFYRKHPNLTSQHDIELIKTVFEYIKSKI